MIIEVDLKIVWIFLVVWSTVCSMLTLAVYPQGRFAQKLALTVSLALVGPFVPLAAVIVMPKIVSDMWVRYLKPSRLAP